MALNLLKKKIFLGLINGPISKKHFLKRNFLGITEYLAKKTNTKNFAMLIYNKKLSVSPITTHLPVKNIGKYISQRKIIKHSQLIKKFYKINLNKNPKIAITGPLEPNSAIKAVGIPATDLLILKPSFSSASERSLELPIS